MSIHLPARAALSRRLRPLLLGVCLAAIAPAWADWRLHTPEAAKELRLPTVSGQPQDLAHLKGKVVLLHFWATYCAPCRKEFPVLNEVYQRLKPKGLELLAVDIAEDAATVQRFLTSTPVGFPVLLDGEGQTMARWNAIGLPTTLLIDRKGRVRGQIVGEVDWRSAEVQKPLLQVLAE